MRAYLEFLIPTPPFDSSFAPPPQELRDIVMNFMIAGRDTTACALSWTFYELAKNPECMEKVLKEVKENCGEDGSGADYENVGKLSYTHAVAIEVSGWSKASCVLHTCGRAGCVCCCPFFRLANLLPSSLRSSLPPSFQVLRLHPSVPVDIKFAKNNDTLPDGTYIPKGSTVLYSPYAIGRSEKVWGGDAKQFKPER